MAWDTGFQLCRKRPAALQEAFALKGDLTEEEARYHLGRLMRYNLGFTWLLISGQDMLLPFQEIILNAWFEKDYSLVIAGRGVGKSYLLSIFILLYAILNENTKIVLVANNFRRVKDIFSQMEKFLNYKKATLLRQCFELKTANKIKMGKQNDQYLLNCINGSLVKGLPLGVGENLRGERANVLIIDEGLLVSEHIQKTILEPFLTARSNAGERVKIEAQEDALVKAGMLKGEDKTVFQNNKLIITSSASYQFEYLFEGLYSKYISNIQDSKKERTLKDPTYFVCRASYEVVPEGSFLAEEVIQAARETNPNDPVFRREYCAEFVDGGGSYFDIKKLHECTIPDGESPTTQVVGLKGCEYILSIDPSYGDSKSSDYFAMGVYLLEPESRKIVQVHSYGKAGMDIKEHYEYLIYLLKQFNIVMLAIDASGTEFIQGFNESMTAKNNNMSLGFLAQDFDTEGDEYQRNIEYARSDLNSQSRHFVYAQPFNSNSIRAMNEYLQGGISAKRVWFGSRMSANEPIYRKVVESFSLPYAFKDADDEQYSLVDFLDDQDDWIDQTKRQLALIEVKSTTLGTLQYDIPSHLKKSQNAKRARRDNYTCLLMAYTASKHYFNIRSSDALPTFTSVPVMMF